MATLQSLGEVFLRSRDATWNQERWEQLPADGNRYEVIDGVLYISTAPSPRHQWIVRNLQQCLFRQIDDAEVGVTLTAPIGLFMPGCEPVQPDVLVIRTADLGMIGARRVEGVPALLIEVLSPSNADQDLVDKRAAYARAGVPEYWVVRPVECDVLVHSQPEKATSQYLQVSHFGPDGELASPTLPVRAAAADFFAGAPAGAD